MIGIDLEKINDNHWEISSLEEAGPTLLAQLQVGDTVVSVDGKPAGDHNSVKKWHRLEGAHEIVVERDGQQIQVILDKGEYRKKFDLLPLVGELISLVFIMLLYANSKRSHSAQYLIYVFLTIAVIYMSLGSSSRGDAIAKICVTTGLMLLPVVFLHFLIIFFKEKGNLDLPYSLIKWLYGITWVVALTKVAYFFPEITYFVYHSSTMVTILFFLIGLIVNFVYLLTVYSRHSKRDMYLSIVIKTILFSLFISFFPFAVFSFLPLLLYSEAWIDPYYTSWIILIFPMSFAYLIIAKRLYDIDTLLRRLFFTGMLSVVPSAIIVSLVYAIWKPPVSSLQLVGSFVCVLLILAFTLYALEYFSSKFEFIMFPRKHRLQKALRQIAKNLGSITSFRELKEIILVDIVQTLQVYGGAIVFKYPDRVEMIGEGEISAEEVERLVKSEWYDDHPVYTCIEMNRHEEYTSYLVMTRKRTNTMLGLEDKQWLNLIISYLAVSLENIHLIRKLTMRMQQVAAQLPNEEAGRDFIWFRRLMFELQEKERVRISTDLHDTTMQDLFFLKKRLASLMDKVAPKQEISEHFRSIIEFIEIINTNLRQSCFDLHPHLLQEIGLIQTIEKLIERESYECPFDILFDGDQAYAIERKDLETKRHLFRMVQELVNNAKKHSQATRVSIQLAAGPEAFVLTYEDNGIGFDSERTVVQVVGASGMGLEQMKSRVLYLSGQFKLETAVGQGVRIEITIPTREGLSA